jgi:ankyrin repeat protein
MIARKTDSIHQEFYRAAKEGQSITRLRYLLSQGANIDTRGGRSNRSALHHAAAQDNHEAVEFLLRYGADVNLRDDEVGTPICVAASRAHERVVEILLEHKAKISASCGGVLGSAMHCACFGGSVAISRSVLARGGSIKCTSIVSLSALSNLAKQQLSSPSLTRSPLASRSDQANHSLIKCTPILLAAERCHFDILQMCWILPLVDNPICSPDNACWEFVPEHDLIHSSYTRCYANRSYNTLQYFSETSFHCSGMSFASSKASTSSAWSFMGFTHPTPALLSSTLLMWAAATLKLELIEHLLESGASVDTTDTSDKSALAYAASPFESANFGNVAECVKRLVGSGSLFIVYESTFVTRNDHSPLSLTVDRGHAALDSRVSHTWGSDVHAQCVAAFLDSMASVPHRKAESHNALYHALSQGVFQLDIVQMLCRDGAALCEIARDTVASTSADLEWFGSEALPTEEVRAGRLTTTEQGWSEVEVDCLHGCSALHVALEHKAPSPVISLLLQNRCDPNSLDYNRRSPLLTAIDKRADIAIILLLLRHGADPGVQDETGTTPRLHANYTDQRDVEWLLGTPIEIPHQEATVEVQCTATGSASTSNRRWFQNMSTSLGFRSSREPG